MDEDTVIRVVSLFAALDSIDYYTLLGVPRLYDRDELRESYYRFAGQMHPDNFREQDEELRRQVYAIFKRAAEAYRVLGDPRLKQHYDQGLATGVVRLKMEEATATRPSSPPEPAFKTLSAKQLWRQACEAEEAGDYKGAKLQLTLVLGHERDNAVVQGKLDAIEKKLKDGAKR
jgi:DnaJ-class molecular chaperone